MTNLRQPLEEQLTSLAQRLDASSVSENIYDNHSFPHSMRFPNPSFSELVVFADNIGG